MLKPIKKLIHENFKDKFSKEELNLLPSSYQKIGQILIINLKEKLHKYDREIGKFLLNMIPDTKTVCRRTGFIENQERTPKIKVIAGNKNTETIHKEHGISYKLDVKKIMFAKGNLNERNRLIKLIKDNEIIVDMFAGIGYFSLGIAKFSNPEKIYSIEINPMAYHYLWENIKLNKTQNKIIPILGDSVVEIPKIGRIVDRVVMGLLPDCKVFLMDALKVVKSNGIIHYHGTAKNWRELFEDVKTATDIEGYDVKLIRKVRVKSYAPKIYHWVLDCKIN